MNKRKLAALMIWWCEGTKPRRDFRWKNAYLYPIEVINTDYKIIKLFSDFLVKDLKVPIKKLHGQIQIHDGDNQLTIEKYWSNVLNIPTNQLNKTIVRKKGNKPGKNFGTFKLRIYDKILYSKLRQMLDKEIREILAGCGAIG